MQVISAFKRGYRGRMVLPLLSSDANNSAESSDMAVNREDAFASPLSSEHILMGGFSSNNKRE